MLLTDVSKIQEGKQLLGGSQCRFCISSAQTCISETANANFSNDKIYFLEQCIISGWMRPPSALGLFLPTRLPNTECVSVLKSLNYSSFVQISPNCFLPNPPEEVCDLKPLLSRHYSRMKHFYWEIMTTKHIVYLAAARKKREEVGSLIVYKRPNNLAPEEPYKCFS